MRSKKGELSEVFRYILVAVAGIILLTGLVYFARGLLVTGENLSATETRETLNDYFTTLATTEYIEAPEDLKIDTTLYFNSPSCQQLRVQQGNAQSSPAGYSHIVYAPEKLTGRSLHVWSASWYMPFRVTNFFYLTNPKIKTVLVGDDALITEILAELPDSMNIEKGSSTNIADYTDLGKNYELVHIIVFGNAAPIKQNNVILTSVQVAGTSCKKTPDGTDRYTCNGVVRFPDGDSPFSGKAMLYGTFFVSTKATYDCNTAAATAKLQSIAALYSQKQQTLKQKLSSCEKFNLDFNYGTTGWSAKATSLDSQNKQLGGRDCDYVF